MKQFLKDIAIIGAGQGAPQGEENYCNDGIPFVKAGNLQELLDGKDISLIQQVSEIVAKKHRLKLYSKGTILFAKSGMSCMKGYVYVLPQDAYVVSHLACITPNEQISEYLRYYFLYHKPNQLVKDASYPSISLTDIGNLEIDMKSVAERSAIVNELNLLDSIVSLRQRELQKLDDLIKARFVEMFGDVIHNNKSWDIYTFSDITESRLGKMLDSKKQTGQSSFPYLANANVQWFRFDINKLNTMDFSEDDREEFALEDGDLMVCEGGEIGRCAVWHNQIQPCYFQKAIHRVRCNRDVILPDYLSWWFKYNCDHQGFADIEGAKATISHLPGAKMKKLQVVVPDIEIQKQFCEFLEQVDKSKFVVQKSLDEAKLLFDSLMQEYFA